MAEGVGVGVDPDTLAVGVVLKVDSVFGVFSRTRYPSRAKHGTAGVTAEFYYELLPFMGIDAGFVHCISFPHANRKGAARQARRMPAGLSFRKLRTRVVKVSPGGPEVAVYRRAPIRINISIKYAYRLSIPTSNGSRDLPAARQTCKPWFLGSSTRGRHRCF